jgi:hypothetical protein
LVVNGARLTIKEATVDKTGEVSQAKQNAPDDDSGKYCRVVPLAKFHKKIRAKPDDVRETGRVTHPNLSDCSLRSASLSQQLKKVRPSYTHI